MQTIESTFEDIKKMRIRGAGRIARASVKALEDFGTALDVKSGTEFINKVKEAGEFLKNARPTAVSLPNAVNYVLTNLDKECQCTVDVPVLKDSLKKYCEKFITRSESAIERIGLIGSNRIQDGDIILTHCNSESAIAIILAAFKQKKNIKVFCTETRPKMQGLLTSSKLAKEGIDVTLIIDSAARFYMNRVNVVVVGADAISVNGAIVNKIGTSMMALAAKESRSRFIVAAESYKISPKTFYGELIPIEERPHEEVVTKDWYAMNECVKIANPAFDITPPEYIDLIVTEYGVFPPQAILLLFKEIYGSIDIINQ
ncbi:MAG: ribose 1,5-bisphosphate isomerase [Nitrososphaeria archaeon]